MDTEENRLEDITIEFLKQWENRHIPRMRHVIKIKKFIKSLNGIVTYEQLENYIMNEFAFDNRYANKMIRELERKEILAAIFLSDNTDLRYVVKYKKRR